MREGLERVESKRLGDGYYRYRHPSGLTLLLAPMEGFHSAFAVFGTAYGSIDTLIKRSENGAFEKLPEGIAHFLEHKLFESEDCSAFERYASTGADANASTGFDRTMYLFSCTENFKESLEILLDFVTHPYFTEETVAKEQGIIGQEIRMYDDSPDWQAFFGTLCAMYHNNPVRINIAGTEESISHITADLLYDCYHTFYNLHNMVLTVAGNFDPNEAIAVADKILEPAKPFYLEKGSCEEPEEIVTEKVEFHLPVSTPMFYIGFKGKTGTEAENYRGGVLDEIFLEALFDDYSPFYRKFYDEGTINGTFGSEVFSGYDYSALLLSGESREPEKVFEEVKKAVANALENGLSAEAFAMAKRSVYGRYIRSTERVEGVAVALLNGHFPDVSLYDLIDEVADATPEKVMERICRTYSVKNAVLSIVKP